MSGKNIDQETSTASASALPQQDGATATSNLSNKKPGTALAAFRALEAEWKANPDSRPLNGFFAW